MGECPALPTELWNLILRLLCDEVDCYDYDSREALLDLSLVSRQIRPIAQKLLCRFMLISRTTRECLNAAIELSRACGEPPFELHIGRYPNHRQEPGQLAGHEIIQIVDEYLQAAKLPYPEVISLMTRNDGTFDFNEVKSANGVLDHAVYLTIQAEHIISNAKEYKRLKYLCLNSVALQEDLLGFLSKQPNLEHLIMAAPKFDAFPHTNFLRHMSDFKGRLTVMNPAANTINDPFFKRIHRDSNYVEDCARERRFYDLQVYRWNVKWLGGPPGWGLFITGRVKDSLLWDWAVWKGRRSGRMTGLSVPY